jgi:3-deoxy-D-manno-octulosonic-acid transferase
MFVYSILLGLGFLIMSPLFLLRREKYASGFGERMGNYPPFVRDSRPVIWLHCVSVGETNAARPLVEEIKTSFPNHQLVVSTTTKTGQDLAKKVFGGKADAIVYFPFDFKFSVRRAIKHFKPSLVLLMETEIWPRFIYEVKQAGAKISIVNGRLSERSASRYSFVRSFISNVLANVDLALMQGTADAKRLISLGMSEAKVSVTGNIKFDLGLDEVEHRVTDLLRERFAIDGTRPLIVAASTHEPEERYALEAFCSVAVNANPTPRLLIAPRHPERFDSVAKLIEQFRRDPVNEWREFSFARRTGEESDTDNYADVILLDTVGELRAVYPLAGIVFVGGSLISHGGQSILEPAAAGKAIITGPHTHNFADAVKIFRANGALIQLEAGPEISTVDRLFDAISDLLEDGSMRDELGRKARSVMETNRGATRRTIEELAKLSAERR